MSLLNEIHDYLVENKSLVLATAGLDGSPQVRHIGGYQVRDLDIFFLTTAGTEKTKEIEKNPQVAALFQHEGQAVPKNITVYGKAGRLTGKEADDGAKLIQQRRPQLVYDPKINEIYKIEAETVKLLDFGRENKQEIIRVSELA